jgi:MOSC domain-containing protein YiiM
MYLLSVNVGQERPIQGAGKSGKTGIYKSPVAEPVEVTATGVAGDVICDLENHGGVDQALYVYGMSDYAWWSGAVGYKLGPGTFGENFTVAHLESADLNVGERLHVGSVTIEVTAPRIPCRTLAARMADSGFIDRFRAAERPGVYCRVIQAGWVQPGDAVALERYGGETISAPEYFRDYYDRHLSEAQLRRYLAAPIHTGDRARKEKQLAKLLAQKNADPGTRNE